jgi:excisionase family DNA binding protein
MEKLKLYTVEELVEILQVTRRTIYRYIDSGELKAIKVGGYWRVSEAALKDFLGYEEMTSEEAANKAYK